MSGELNSPIIYVYDFEDRDVAKFIESLDDLESSHSADQDFIISINSSGGNLSALSGMLTRLNNSEHRIHTICNGRAFSAGLMLLAFGAQNGGSRVAIPGAALMLHEITWVVGYGIADIEDQTNHLVACNTYWNKQWADVLGLSRPSEVRDFIKKHAQGTDLYMSPNKAKNWNIIDRIGSIKVTPNSTWNVTLV